MSYLIPFSKPDIRDSDISRVKKSIKSGWLTHGKNSLEFEKEFKKFTKAKYATTIANCTAGLHLACLSIGLTKGDEVIVPAQTHTATAHAVEFTGAKAVFADTDSLNGNILFSEIKKKINKKTKAIIIVHMAGLPCELKKISKLCNYKKIHLIEDCAHALGSTYGNKHVGNFGKCGVFSFYPTKQITSGEGGVLITNNRNFYNKVKMLKAFGIDNPPEKRKKQGFYDVKYLGFNYRMTDFQAALALGQLQRYKKLLKVRRNIAKNYEKNLTSNKLRFVKFNKSHSYFVFQVVFESKKIRDGILAEFKKNGIGASIHYATPVPLLSYYKKKYKFNNKHFKNSKIYSDRVISLPVHSGIDNKKINYIKKIIYMNI